MNNEETQVNEQPNQTEPSLEGVEIVSNGTKIDTTDKQEETKQDESTEENKTSQEQEKAKEPPAEQKELQDAKAEQEDIKNELSSKGVDYAKLEKSYADNGKLSEDEYKQLEGAGYPKAVVNAIIAGWQAKADAFVNKVIDTAGGKREFERMQKFIQEQGQSAVNAFNEIVEKSDLNVVSAYLTGIKAQMVAKYGTNNPSLGGGSAASGVKGYADANEMVKAMSDPRYGKDPKYMAEVEQKVAKSTFF